MVQEHNFVCGLDDIAAIRFDCRCGASLSLTTNAQFQAPTVCPECRKQIAGQRPIYDIVAQFLESLRAAKTAGGEEFSIRLVFKIDHSQDSARR
jgi:hypothetical protein